MILLYTMDIYDIMNTTRKLGIHFNYKAGQDTLKLLLFISQNKGKSTSKADIWFSRDIILGHKILYWLTEREGDRL